ncbi:MAG: hypothetical protein IT454_00030 [Planctomycetes bacterium]|nr:hypothetical protein [Planctomycetota bacterium]
MGANQQEPQGGERGTVYWLDFAARTLACPLEVSLHDLGTFGQRYFGLQWLAAVAAMVLFPGFFPGCDPTPLWVWTAAFVLGSFVAKAKSDRRRARGEFEEHSYYGGTPSLMRVLRRAREAHVKGAIEPVLAFFTGAVLTGWNEALGMFLILAALALLFCVKASELQNRTRALDMHDAMIDQRRVTDQWRRTRR